MDPRNEMQNLRVLNDYLNQTLDVLVRGPRPGAGHAAGFGYSPFGGQIPAPAAGMGTDTVYGPGSYGFGAPQTFGGLPYSPFPASNPFTGQSMIGGGYAAPYGTWQQAWGQSPWTGGQTPWTAGQTPWTPIEAARQAQVTQTLAAKQSVLEAMCRVAGIPV